MGIKTGNIMNHMYHFTNEMKKELRQMVLGTK
jgi:hypothetical protein